MARDRRHFEAGYPYHVFFRGNNRRRLFSYKRDRVWFLRLLREAVHRVAVDAHAASLMTNHGHLIATPQSEEALSVLMKTVAQRYAIWRNRKQGGSGKLFEERFRAKRIVDDRQYGVTMAYVELNSYRAGLTYSTDAEEWSSLGLHTGRGPERWASRFRDWITPSSWYLELGADPETRSLRYREWIVRTLEHAEQPRHWETIGHKEAVSGARPRRPDGRSAE